MDREQADSSRGRVGSSGSSKKEKEPWLVWLSGLSASLQTKGLQVLFPVPAHAWVAGQVLSRGYVKGNYTLMFLSLFHSLKLNK